MCRGNRLVADFVAGTDTRPGLPEELHEHLTMTVDGLWVVWAHKLARQAGNLFVPLSRCPSLSVTLPVGAISRIALDPALAGLACLGHTQTRFTVPRRSLT